MSLFGSGELTELPKELTDLLAQSKRDSKALREFLKRSETAAKKFERLVDPLEAMQATAKSLNAQMSELQGRVDSFGEAVSTIDAVAGQAAGLAESQAAHVSSTEEADSKIGELTTKVTELRTVVEGAMTAKDEVAELVGPESPVTQLLEEVKSVRADLRQAEERTTALGESVSRFEVLEQRADELGKSQENLTGSVERSTNAADRVEERIGEIQAHLLAVSTTEKLIADLMGPKGSFTKIRADMDGLVADVGRLEGRADALHQVEERIVGVSEQASGMEQDQKSMARSFESVLKRLVETDAKVSELDDGLQAAGLVKQELENFVGPSGALAKVRGQVEEVREQSLAYAEEVARIREDQAGVRAAQESVSSEYGELRSKLESVDEGVDKANANVARVEKAKLDLTKAEELGARTQRQLSALQALSDHIIQKTGSVERQREALDRTEAQARALTDLHWELEAKLKEARSQIKDLKKVHSSVDDLRDMNAKVAERTGELRTEQAEVVRESKTLRAGLAGLQEQMRRTTKRFELEQSTLEADGQRVIALRADVTDLESRLHKLEESGPSVNEASRKVDEMSARLTSLSGELGRIGEQVELVEGMREGMSEAQRMAVDVAASLSKLEARQSDVQESMDDLQTLRGTGEEVAEALESLRATRSEIQRSQTGQAETGAWLAGTHESIQELRKKVAQLNDLTTNIDHMRENADRVIAAASDLDERRESFDELEVRMSELGQIGTQLDERTNNLLSGLVDADNRFKAVARNAEKADDARVMVEGIMGAVEQAERQMAELGEGVDSAAERSEALTLLSQRADRVMADIRRGEKALSKAVEQLESLSTLRKEAADAVQSLEDQIRAVKEGLVLAEEQSDKIGQRADLLEARAGSLRFAEKRITQFEEKLARLDGVEQELQQSTEALLARQESVGQVRSDVQELFAASEKTLDDVRAISAARDEVQSATEVLEAVRTKADAMTGALESIDLQQQQIEQAEGRLGRADALLREIRASLESLTSQRAVIDQVIATSGRLSVEAREAEGLLDALREERELTQGIHDALKELRREESETVHVDFGKKGA